LDIIKKEVRRNRRKTHKEELHNSQGSMKLKIKVGQ
jgi:hypothetical protein